MGYDTTYRLSAQNISHEDFIRLVDRLDELDVIGYALVRELAYSIHYEPNAAFIDTNGECHWYDHHDVMVIISKEFPEVRFRLDGEGEDRDDVWSHYYCNGVDEKCGIIITEVQPTKILWEKEES